MDPDQTAPVGAFRFGSSMFVEGASTTFQQTLRQMTFVVNGTLWVKPYILV